MDELNYRRVTALPKRRCEDCGATAYLDPDKTYRCVVCDHERYEVCLDCGHLMGWCLCEENGKGAVVVQSRTRSKRGAKK